MHVTKMATGIAVVCAMAIALVGCAPAPPVQKVSAPPEAGVDELSQQNDALDAYVEAERETIPAIMQATPGMYSEVTIDGVYPDTVEYDYVYAQQVDPAEARDYFDSMAPTLQTLCDTGVFPAMQSAGVVSSPKVTFTYNNADGSQIWSHTFESS